MIAESSDNATDCITANAATTVKMDFIVAIEPALQFEDTMIAKAAAIIYKRAKIAILYVQN